MAFQFAYSEVTTVFSRLVYNSRLHQALDPVSLKRLVQLSTARNSEHGISGCLYVTDQYALQILEGEEQSVGQLLANIEKDPRHTIQNTHWFHCTLERKFSKWGMKCINGEKINNTMEKIDQVLNHGQLPQSEIILVSCINILESYYFIHS